MTATKAVLGAVALSLIAGVLSGAVVSRAYWGYAFERPTVPRAVQSATRLRRVTPLSSLRTGADCTLELDRRYSVAERIGWARQDPYYAHEGRLFEGLLLRGLCPVAAPDDARLQAGDLHRTLRAGGVLRDGEPGYGHATCVAGAAVEVEDEAGTASLVVGLHGHQVSNDHYPYYEATFRRADGIWHLQGVQTYFYDVAGVEGFEWPVLHGAFVIVALGCLATFGLLYSTLHRSRWLGAAAAANDGIQRASHG